jgi:hypothetical protein
MKKLLLLLVLTVALVIPASVAASISGGGDAAGFPACYDGVVGYTYQTSSGALYICAYGGPWGHDYWARIN